MLISVDNLGLPLSIQNGYRETIAQRIGTEKEAVYIACTHTHLAPSTAATEVGITEPEYCRFLGQKLSDAAWLAIQDAAPTKMLFSHGRVEDVAFIRRFLMKDGSVKTNPGRQNPEIDHPLGEPDEQTSLLILKREGKPEIGIVHFQVHPDVIGGRKVSADFPGFARKLYEKLIPNSLCMYLNGAQGDTNHIDVRHGPDELTNGYGRSRYMGEKIAMSVAANYPLAKVIEDDTIRYGQIDVPVLRNQGTPEQTEKARVIYEDYMADGIASAEQYRACKQRHSMNSMTIPQTVRIMRLAGLPERTQLPVTVLRVGGAVFAGFPGEAFTKMGQILKTESPFDVTFPTCCTNGYEGYFPTQDAFDMGAYETRTTRFCGGTAEKLTESALELIRKLSGNGD